MRDIFIFAKLFNSKRHRRHSSKKGGFALILVLAFVVLLTALAISFLVRALYSQKISSSSVSGFHAEQLSLSALNLILTDLRSEIAAGSTLTTSNSIPVYKPTNGNVMVPARVLSSNITPTDSNFQTLVKQSIRSLPFFPSGAPYNQNSTNPVITSASQISTATASTDGRTVSATRWNLPLLLKGSGFTANQVPDWIYYSNQDGISFPTTPNRKFTGRIAYNIYNIGGLLDINVAGFSGTPSTAQMAILKGTLAGADLKQIPGITSVDSLVSWRNAASGTDYTGYVSGAGVQSGFLKPVVGDKTFVTRQDLIRWVETQSGGNIAQTALPFLTHFTRESNAPSWNPTTPTGSSINYTANAEATGKANRFAPNVRVPGSGFTRADGSIAQTGEPLIKTRFPLSRIAGIGRNGINSVGNSTLDNNGAYSPASAKTIQRDFGLVWDPTNFQWTYAGATGSTALGAIETLDVVAGENREPNFFETLKAAILEGALGRDGGVSNSDTVAYDDKSDYQIIQIGANIIDQYRSDDFPIHIAFDPTNAPVFAGSTSLPAIDKMLRLIYRPASGVSTPLGTQPAWRQYVGAWFVPEIWNCYEPSLLGATTATLPPMRIRVKDGDQAQLITSMYIQDKAGNATGPIPPLVPAGPQVFSAANSTITASAASASTYSIPNVITSGSTSTSSNVITDTGGFGPTLLGINVGYVNVPDTSAWCGTTTLSPSSLLYPVGTYPQQKFFSAYINTSPYVTFIMEYADPDHAGNWLQCDMMKNTWSSSQQQGLDAIRGGVDISTIYLVNESYLPTAFQTSYNELIKPVPCCALERTDARTDRFGTSNAYASQLGYSRATAKSDIPPVGYNYYTQSTLPRTTSSNPNGYSSLGLRNRGINGWQGLVGNNGNGSSLPGWHNAGTDIPIGALSENVVGSNLYYGDNDGIVRPAAGAYQACLMDNLAMRPIMLNRPFYSVGDLGYVDRGEPWKDLNFFTKESGDSALLDYFSAYEEPAVVAGRVSINSAPTEVMTAILNQSIKTESVALTQLSTTEASSIATALNAEISANGPFTSRADLVVRFASNPALTPFPEKSKREAFVRALAPVIQTRTWNLLIDLVAQTGRFAPSATTLDNFTVEGERHVWISVAIDRFTGKVVDEQIELVRE